jgi:3-keto-5-aminohexanoate cleavage enzyme
MQKLIIEAAINEQATKAENPNVPYSPEDCVREAIACADAGAAIVHFHARDVVTGDMLEPGTDFYLEATRAIRRARPDVLVYPTYGVLPTKEARFSHVRALAEDPVAKLNMATIDPGAANLAPYDEAQRRFLGDFTFNVSHVETEYVMGIAREHGFPFSVVCREPGHVRHAVGHYRAGHAPAPLFVKICLTNELAWGMPPSARAIEAYLSVIPPDVPHIWMVYTYGQSHWPMNLHAIAAGGHVRTGLGDNPVEPDGGRPTSAEQVARVVEIARQAGRETATPKEALAIMTGRA